MAASKYKLIIWDWNGTLYADRDISLMTVNYILDKRGMPPITLEQYYSYVDTPITRFYEHLFDMSKVSFDENIFGAFMKGYMREAGVFMDAADRTYLYDAIRLLPFELGLRFFQDYLAGDRYFKVRQPGQNLNRARVQFRLCEAIEAREGSIRGALSRL